MKYLFDTSALVLLLEKQGNYLRCEELLSRRLGAISFVTLTEVYYRYAPHRYAQGKATFTAFSSLPFSVLYPNMRIIELAGELKHDFLLGIADAYIAATAVVHELTLVHRDKDFLQLKNIQQEYLGR